MVVDDDLSVLISVKIGLEEITSDYNIINVESGKECLKKLKNEELPDLILLDIMMPEMNGWDVAAEIRKNDKWNNIPILFLTAKDDFNSRNFGSIVSQDYISKPFDTHDLKKRIDNNLNKLKTK